MKLRPVDFATRECSWQELRTGRSSSMRVIAQASGAAREAMTIISKDFLETQGIIAAVNDMVCDGCGICEPVCEYKAITTVKDATDPNKLKAVVNEGLCMGCGTCVAACPSGALEQKGFKNNQIDRTDRRGPCGRWKVMSETVTQTQAKLAETGEYEPKLVVFCCNWCSYAGADLAGVSRLQMPTNFRVIRTMCSARVDPEFVLRAFANGADGVLILGCHPADCHYIGGNYRTRRRIALLRVLLEQYGFNPDRLKLEWVSASEGAKFQKTIKEFNELIKELGPNPINDEE